MSTRKFMPILIVIALLAGLLGFAVAPAAAAPGDVVFSWSLPAGQINPGATFSVPLNVTVQPGVPFTGGQFNLSWNPAVVRLVNVSNGTFIPNNCPAGAVPFFNAGTINAAAGTLVNYGFAALGVAAGQGCTGTGTMATLNFEAVALGLSTNAVSGIIMSYGSFAAPAADITFAGFNQYVGAAPRLVVTGVSFVPAGGTPAGTIFDVAVTVSNTGGVASPVNTVLAISATNATPASQNFSLPSIAGASSQTFSFPGYQLAAGAGNSVVTAAIAEFSTSSSNTYSPVSSQGNTNVDATFGAFINITPDTLVDFGRLQLGVNNTAGAINVRCNTNWQVDVTDPNASAWHMTEYDGSSFVASPRRLIEAMAVTSNTQSRTVSAGTPSILLNGDVSGQVNDNGQNFGLTYTQTLRYADSLLPAGRSYHLVLTYNGFVTQ